MGRAHRVRLALFFLHFALIILVCLRAGFSALTPAYTILPASLERGWRKAGAIASTLIGERLGDANPVRNFVQVYLHSTGSDGGYGFFAPNVPNNFKLVLEFHYPDGRVEYELPYVNSAATGLRLSSLLDRIAQTESAAVRELMVKMLAYSVWREHSDATLVRAVFGFVHLPTAAEFKRGEKESYQFLYAYDFTFGSDRDGPALP